MTYILPPGPLELEVERQKLRSTPTHFTTMADDLRRAALRAGEIRGWLDDSHVWLVDLAAAVNIPMALFAPMVMQLHRYGLVTLAAVLPDSDPDDRAAVEEIAAKLEASTILYGNIGTFHALQVTG